MPFWPFLIVLAGFALTMIVPGVSGVVNPTVAIAILSLTALAAALAMLIAGVRSEGSVRRSRLLLGVGWMVVVLAGAITALTKIDGGNPADFPSIPDLVFLASIPLITVGLLNYPISTLVGASRVNALLDGAIAATAIWLVIYTLVLVPSTQASGVPSVSELATVAYPAAVTFVAGIAVSMLLRVSTPARRELSLIAVGVGLLWFQEIARSVLLAQGSYRPGSWLAVLSQGAFLLFLFAALSAIGDRNQGQLGAAEEDSANTWSRWLPFLPFVTVGIALLVGFISVTRGNALTAVGFDSGVVLILLLLGQQLISNRELGQLNADLRKNSELFESLVTGSSDLITLHNADGTLRYASPSVWRLLDIEPHDVIGKPLSFVVHPDDISKVTAAYGELLKTPGGTVQLEVRVGPGVPSAEDQKEEERVAWRWVEAVAHNMLDDANVSGIVVNTRDIHDQQLLRHRLSYEAYHDTLTGLGNLALARRIFAEHCYGPNRSPVTMILADLDGFKTINDTFGHNFGDDVLVAVARRIRLTVDDEDQVARIGGDEFVFILDSEQDADAAAHQILEAIRRPFIVQGNTVNVAASVGIARSVDATDAVELLRNADLAMYAAKSAGGSKAVWYDAAMHEETAYRLRIQDGLRRALDDDSFELHYQPIVALPSGNVVGAEALLRWEDTKLGKMFPDVFIPIAEGTGISSEIDEWVVNEACSQMRAWWDAGVNVAQVSVNISRRQLTGALAGIVRRALDEHRLPTQALCIEVTESAVVADAELARRALEEIRSMGIRVALDDFGTGESSLSQLSTLPVDRVKIDKSFVMPSSSDPEALNLLESIVGVCRTMGMPIVAEGVEDEIAVQNLTRMGVDFAQGYHYFRPLPANEVGEKVASRIPGQRTAKTQDSTATEAQPQPEGNVIYTRFG